ncbi:MAG: TetR/AcrR family transcriptional regulator [Actinomycetota bacterium]
MSADTRRGRPRNESCTSDILHAALALVAELGMAGLTMDAVATRAGVGKATIYRRWPSKEALMLDAWALTIAVPLVPDTGSLRGDLLELLSVVDDLFSDANLRRVFPQMVAAAKVDPDTSEAYRSFVASRRAPMQTVLQRAVRRGEIGPDLDLGVVQDLLIAPLMYRWLITDAPIDRDVIVSIVDLVTAGVARTAAPVRV